MNKWLEELKQLDTKNPGNWPWPVKIAALGLLFVAILVAGYFVFYQNQLSDLEAQQRKETELKTTFLEKKKLAVNLEAYQQQRAEIEQSFGALLKQLPTRSEMDALLIDINQARLFGPWQVGLELLLLNGALMFGGLWLVSRRAAPAFVA